MAASSTTKERYLFDVMFFFVLSGTCLYIHFFGFVLVLRTYWFTLNYVVNSMQ